MKRKTLETLMTLAQQYMPDDYAEVLAQMNATIDVDELARQGYVNSPASLVKATGGGTIKWDDLTDDERSGYVAFARGVLDGVLASGAIVEKNMGDATEQFGVRIV